MTDTVVVVGPALAGVSAVTAALRDRLEGAVVVETAALRPGQFPDAVVFVTTAAAPMSPCDAALFAAASARTDAVVAAVTKIDVHRTWRSVLEANRALHPAGRRPVPWVGVAADPEIGARVIAPVVDAIRAVLDDGDRGRRNVLRAHEWTLEQRIAERQREAARLTTLRARAAGRDATRLRIRQTRIDLAQEARRRSAELRADLQREAATVSRLGLEPFATRVHLLAQQMGEDFDAVMTKRMAEVGGVPAVAPAPIGDLLPPPRRAVLEDRLAAIVGTGFGLGVALTLGRALAEMTPVATPAVVAVCVAVGTGLAGWVVRARRLVGARIALQRWVSEVAAGVRAGLEERVLAAESALLAAHHETAAATEPAPFAQADRALKEWIAELARVRAELGENPD